MDSYKMFNDFIFLWLWLEMNGNTNIKLSSGIDFLGLNSAEQLTSPICCISLNGPTNCQSFSVFPKTISIVHLYGNLSVRPSQDL